MKDIQSLLQEQITYYRARASEYDEWFLRQGRYDHGPELNQRWFQEIEQVRAVLAEFRPQGRVLELACGTGLWTQQLLKHAAHITAVDAAAEVIALNRQRLQSPLVDYIQTDIFTWQPQETYDIVFFSFWLSHVPAPYFEPFWQMVARALKPGGRVFFVDSKYETTSTARDHPMGPGKDGLAMRRLKDGSEYQVVKIFYHPGPLMKKLQRAGWSATISETPSYFLYGEASRTL